MTQRFNPFKNNFAAGEWSPRLDARDDLDQYFQSLRQALNGIVLPHGGYMSRSGTRYVAEVKDSSKATRLIPFEVGTDAAYVVEMGDIYTRYYTNEGRLEVASVPVEDVSPFVEADLDDVYYVQEAEKMYLAGLNNFPYTLERTTTTNFTLSKMTFKDGKAPLQALNTSSTTITVTGAGPYTLTASAALWRTGGEEIGRAVRIKNGNEAWYEITAVSSSTVATATRHSGSTPTANATDWQLGMFSDVHGPRALALHEGRLWFFGCADAIDRFAGSDSDVFDRFSNDPTADDNAIYGTANSPKVNAIQWATAIGGSLFFGTTGGEFKIKSTENSNLTPQTTVAVETSTTGSAHRIPTVIDTKVHFLQRSKQKLRQFRFDFAQDNFVPDDISIQAEHVLRDGATHLAYQQEPDSILWSPRDDGTLVGFTIENQQSVIGAHRHILGGSYAMTAAGTAQVRSHTVIPNPAGTADQLWMVVRRTIDGATKQYVEFMEDTFKPDLGPASSVDDRQNALKDAWFIDSGLELNNPVTITGATQADPVVITAAGHGRSNGDQVYIDKIIGMTELNDRPFLVANATASTFELQDLTATDIDGTGYTAYVTGGEAREMVNSVSGLDHLEGETVQVFTDGSVHPERTVASGAITLDDKYGHVKVGLGFTYKGETQRFIGGGRIGSDQGQNANISVVVFRVHDSFGGKAGVGPNPDTLDPIVEREGSFDMDRPPPLQSGDFTVEVGSDWDTVPTVYFEQTDPYPFTILAIMPRARVGER